MRHNLGKAALAAWWLAGALAARGEDVQPDFSAGMLARSNVLARAATVTRDVYPDAETVNVGSRIYVAYQPDGSYVQWQETYSKILSEDGRRSSLTLTSHFTIPYQRGPEDCRIPLVEIIKPGGRVVPVDVAANSRVTVDPSGMDENIYNPNDKQIEVNIPGLEVGDLLHFVMFDRIVKPRMTGAWADWFVLETDSPLLEQEIEINAPADLPLRSTALKAPVPGTVTSSEEPERDGRIVYRWTARNVPQAFPEPNMPPLYTVAQRLLVSTIPDWESVSRWYWELSEPRLRTSSELDAKVAELTEGKLTRFERIQAVFSFVSQQIRYMGIMAEATAPGYEPHDVVETYKARHGVCRDKAALLVAMLRQAGVEAYPTLIHKGPLKDTEVPQPFFNHAVVAVKENDEYILMDPTDETTTEWLPAYLDNRSYLVATPKGDRLRTSAQAPAGENLMVIRTRGRLHDDGRLSAETVFQFEGVNDNAYRQYLAGSRAEQRRQLFEGFVKRAAPGASVNDVAFVPTDIMDTSTTLTVRVRYEAEDCFVRGKEFVMLPLPVVGTRVGMVNHVLGQTGLTARRFPLRTDMACGVREEIELELPEGLHTPVALPTSVPVRTNAVSWSLDVRQRGNALSAVSDFRLETVEFSPAEYGMLKGTLREMERALRKMPVYAVGAGVLGGGTSADVFVEEDRVRYVLKDSGAWTEDRTVRKRILTYAGRKQESELKVAFNPAWESVRMDYARTVSPSGVTNVVSDKEMNLMDAPWVSGAPRYPPERTWVFSFPAVSAGTLIEYRLVREARDRPFFSAVESFRGSEAIGSKTVTVDAPLSVRLAVSSNAWEGAAAVGLESVENGRRIMTWTVRDMPSITEEDLMPPPWDFVPTLVMSAGDWSAYAGRVGRLLDEAAAGQTQTVARVDALLRGVTSPVEKIRRIHVFVAEAIRPAGPGLSGLPLSAIGPADRTLAEGYGNSADRAVVLAAMVRAAGFTPRFVAASGLPALERLRRPFESAPVPGLFDTVLVSLDDRGLDLDPGCRIYLGDGDQYDEPGASPQAGNWGLEMPDGRAIAIRPQRENSTAVSYAIELEASGTARLVRSETYEGVFFGQQRRRFSRMTPEELRRYQQELAGAISQGAEVEGEIKVDFVSYPGKVELAVKIPQFAVRDRDLLYFTLPLGLDGELRLRADRRVNPLFFGESYEDVRGADVRIPPGFEVVALPPPLSLKGPYGTDVTLSVHAEGAKGTGTRVVAESSISRFPAVVSQEEYARLLGWARDLSHKRSRTVVLKEVSGGGMEQARP